MRLDPGYVGVEIVAPPPCRQAVGERRDLDRAGGPVRPRHRVDAAAKVRQVHLVGNRVVGNRLAVRVDRHLAVPVVAYQCDRPRRVFA